MHDMNKSQTIEEEFINQISGDLGFFRRQSSAYRFLCPYCQHSGRDSKGKSYAPGDGKGYFYKKFNTWNFKCHKEKCRSRTQKSQGKTLEKFLADHFPKEHLDYVRRRDELGLTGYQTNCPTLETLLKKRGVLGNPPEFHPKRPQQKVQSPTPSSSARSIPLVSTAPKLTKLDPVLSPQKLAGIQAPFNRQEKQRAKRRREREGW